MHLFIGFITLAGFVFLSSLLIYDLATRKRRNIRDRLMGIAQRDDETEGEDIEPLMLTLLKGDYPRIYWMGAFANTPEYKKKSKKRCGRRLRKRTEVSLFTIQSIWLISCLQLWV